MERLDIPYAVTGSYASTMYGEPRFSLDVDILALLEQDDVPALLRSFPPPSFYLSEDAVQDAIKHRSQFNILHDSGLKIDIYVRSATDMYVRRQFHRRVRVRREAADYAAFFLSPEDVIIGKLRFHREGGSDRQLRDIAGIVKRHGDKLDRAYLEEWATTFGVLDIWNAILKRVEQAP